MRVFALRKGFSDNGRVTAEDLLMARLETAHKEQGLIAKTSAQAGAVTTFEFDVYEGWQQSFLLMADNHHDSILCNRKLEREHFNEAMERNALIFVFGDFFDAMEGKFDKRMNYDELRPEYKRTAYYSAVVKDCATWLIPHVKNLALMADGNHELSVINNGTDILGDMLRELNHYAPAPIKRGGYGGWIRLVFNHADGTHEQVKLKYFHGSGGEAPVTRGAIQTNRQAVYLPDADIVVNGHSHNSYYIPIARERMGEDGRMHFDLQHHIRVPGYKQSYGDGSAGWDVTRGGVPKPIGAAWLNFKLRDGKAVFSVEADIRGADPVSLAPEMYGGKTYNQDTEYP